MLGTNSEPENNLKLRHGLGPRICGVGDALKKCLGEMARKLPQLLHLAQIWLVRVALYIGLQAEPMSRH